MKQAIQLCFFIVFLVCNSIYAQPSTPSTTDPITASLAYDCSTVTPGGTMNKANLELTLGSLVLFTEQGTLFGTSTTEDTDGTNFVQGVYYCRGDNITTAAQCEACVASAAKQLETCTTGNSGIAWHAGCTVHVANFEVSGVLQTEPYAIVQPNPNQQIPDFSAENDDIVDLHLKTITEAKEDIDLHFSFNFIDFGSNNIYGVMVQCSPDLSSNDCEICVEQALKFADECTTCTPGPMAAVLLPSCQYVFGFEVFPVNP